MKAEDKVSRRNWKSRLLYFTPFYAIGRAAESISQTKNGLSESLSRMRDKLPGHNQADEFPAEDARSIKDGRERFEVMYAMHEWNDSDIETQKVACNRTKLVSLLAAVFSFATVIASIFFAPLWMLIFIVPVGGCLCILGLAQAFKFALYETQLEMRDLIGAKEFYAREDFFLRLIG